MELIGNEMEVTENLCHYAREVKVEKLGDEYTFTITFDGMPDKTVITRKDADFDMGLFKKKLEGLFGSCQEETVEEVTVVTAERKR